MSWYKRAKREKHPFEVSGELEGLWNRLVRLERDRAGAYMDFENDYPLGTKQIKLDYHGMSDKQDTFWVFGEAREASHDGDCPNLYFRAQIKRRLSPNSMPSWSDKFVFFPTDSPNLKPTDEGWRATSTMNGDDCEDIDYTAFWDQLKEEAERRLRKKDQSDPNAGMAASFQDHGLVFRLDNASIIEEELENGESR